MKAVYVFLEFQSQDPALNYDQKYFQQLVLNEHD